MSFKPIVFVAMPFGTKRFGRYNVDFDSVFNQAIKPVEADTDVEIIRADEERFGGFIHGAMYERLLLAEIVIADLTMANANVFYELGIRHCAKPKSTILIFSSSTKLPFDVAPLRAIPYRLSKGVLIEEVAQTLRMQIGKRLEEAKEEGAAPDSPVFQLVKQFPGVPLSHNLTESFRERVRHISEVQNRIEQTRYLRPERKALDELKIIEQDIGYSSIAPPELHIALLLAYRDMSAWNEVIRLVENFPSSLKDLVEVREQLALALNRRNEGPDRKKAIGILTQLISDYGNSPETCGILGRIYKDMYQEAKTEGSDSQARGALSRAIEMYQAGFNEDPRDYYPGINALTLLFHKDDAESQEKFEELLPLVRFAIGRKGGLNSNDYWDLATALELEILRKDWKMAKRALEKVLLVADVSWKLKTTDKNLSFIEEKLAVIGGSDLEEIQKIRSDIATIIQRMQGDKG